ncbi:MAG TPA: hypothetical protein PKE53_05485 [Flavobacteriales bacterium]|jgi:hypothetical protein|nr:hypothetical protein [Flavobacteriales bacterium]
MPAVGEQYLLRLREAASAKQGWTWSGSPSSNSMQRKTLERLQSIITSGKVLRN